MSPFWDGIGAVIGKLSTFIPGRIEGLKNEKQRLIEQRENIMACLTNNGVDRILAINHRVSAINKILSNNAKD